MSPAFYGMLFQSLWWECASTQDLGRCANRHALVKGASVYGLARSYKAALVAPGDKRQDMSGPP